MKKILAALTLLLFGLADSGASAEWRPANLTEADTYNRYFLAIADSSFGPKMSYLMSSTVISGQPNEVEFCEDLTGACSTKVTLKPQLEAGLLWNLCKGTDEIDCVNGLSLEGQELVLEQLAGASISPNKAYTLPGGGGPIQAKAQDGRIFLLVPSAKYLLLRSDKYFSPMKLEVQILPVSKVSGSYPDLPKPVNNGRESFQGPATGCLWNTATECWQETTDLSEQDNFQLDVNLSSRWSGFFKGRLDEPSLEMSSSGSIQRLKVSGKPVVTQKIFFEYDPEALTKEQIDAVCLDSNWCQFRTTYYPGVQTHLALPRKAIAMLKAFKDQHQDRSAASYAEWSFGNAAQSNQPCLGSTKGLAGLVTTNAPIYPSGPPTYNSGYLTYEIGGLHYQVDGQTLNIGNYNLILRSDVARCLYGFTNAPVSATVQVVSDSGQQVTSVTTVGESKGWLSLNANGFTYSQKKIKIKISQALSKKITKFSGTKSTLTSQQKSQITSAVLKRAPGEVITCTATYQKSTQKALASKRASAACSYAKSINKKLVTKTEVVQTAKSSLNGSLQLTSK